MNKDHNSTWTKWAVAKGIPATHDNIVDVINACYNMLVTTLMDLKSDAEIHWFNKEIYVCLRKVMVFLNNEEFTLPWNKKSISCGSVSNILEQIGVHQALTCKIKHALESLCTCIVVVWNSKSKNEDKLFKDEINKIIRAMETLPFDCVIEESACNFASRDKMPLLLQVGALNFDDLIGSPLDDFQQYQAYAMAYTQYKCGKYEKALQLLQSFLQKGEEHCGDLLQINLANIFNVIGCCYAQLESHHTAIVYLRKAIQCKDNHFACHLNNIGHLYHKLGKLEAAEQITDILVVTFEAKRTERTNNTVLLLHSGSYLQVSILPCISHWGWPKDIDSDNIALYFAAQASLRVNHLKKSVKYYDRILKQRNDSLSLERCNDIAESPTNEQLLAERELALSETDTENSTADAEYVKMKNHIRILSKKLETTLSNLCSDCSDQLLKDFAETGRNLYHCICYILCFIKRFINNAERENLVSVFDDFGDCVIKGYHISDISKKNTDETLYQRAELIEQNLNDIQAKFLLNKAIVMVCIDKNAEIFHVLQKVLKLAPQNIEIRWKLTLLLWKQGHKGEACKTWMKTRALDYRMSAKQIVQIISERSSGDVEDYKRTLYQKDIAILKEVYKSKQLPSK